MKYEYKTVIVRGLGYLKRLDEELNKMGAEGWELKSTQPFSINGDPCGVILFFARAIEE